MRITFCTLKTIEYHGDLYPKCTFRTKAPDNNYGICSKNIIKCPYLRSFNVEDPVEEKVAERREIPLNPISIGSVL